MAVSRVSRTAINALTRTIKSDGDTSTLWTPRVRRMSLQQTTVVGVDTGNNVAHVALNGSDQVAYGVRYSEAYGPDTPPQEGDLALGHYDGKNMVLWGRQVVPNRRVTLP